MHCFLFLGTSSESLGAYVHMHWWYCSCSLELSEDAVAERLIIISLTRNINGRRRGAKTVLVWRKFAPEDLLLPVLLLHV